MRLVSVFSYQGSVNTVPAYLTVDASGDPCDGKVHDAQNLVHVIR